MSLASHFQKKSVARKPRTNISIVSEKHKGGAKSCQLGTKSKPRSKDDDFKEKISNINPQSSVAAKQLSEDEDRGESFGFKFNVGGSDMLNNEKKSDGTKKQDSPFTFDFAVDEGSSNTKSRKKRKNRRKNKKNKKTDDFKQDDESVSDGFDNVDTQAMHSFVNSVEAIIPDECSPYSDSLPKVNGQIIGEKEVSHQRIFQGESHEHMSPYASSNKKKDRFNTIIRTPPGFSSKNKVSTDVETIPTNTLQVEEAKSGNFISKTPGNKPKKKKKAVSTQRQAQMKALEEKRTTQGSRKVPRTKDMDMKLHFNTSDKGRAMVNHGSLLIHKERNKLNSRTKEAEASNDKNGSSSPFSFGFNFNSLLQDL